MDGRDGTNESRQRRYRPAVPVVERGQTTLDFAIGMSLFLAILIFIFLFIPGLLSPFTTGAETEPVTTNRVADRLSQGMLASPRDPYILNEHCTQQFFNDSGVDASSWCSGEWDGSDSLETRMGFDPARTSLNVTVRGNLSTGGSGNDILCWDDSHERVRELNAGCTDSDDVTLTRGDTPPANNEASVTALRVVSLAGEDVTLYVEMW